MINSMTGYGNGESSGPNYSFLCEARSVNHRQLEIRIKLPGHLQSAEEFLRPLVKKYVSRGKIDINIQKKNERQTNSLSINEDVAQNFKKLLENLRQELNENIPLSMRDLMAVDNLIERKTHQNTDQSEEEKYLLIESFEKALASLEAMRQEEGKRLLQVMNEHINISEVFIEQIETKRKKGEEAIKTRLHKNLENLQIKYDENNPRLMQEIGILIERGDISEEINRFQAHLGHYRQIIEEDRPTGRKLDFLSQEMNREINTICSKVRLHDITVIGIELKNEIEKFREQIQNIE